MHSGWTSTTGPRGPTRPFGESKTRPTLNPTRGIWPSVAGIFAAFARWEAELYKVGHAVIHDKIVVLDPFTDDSVVITGSHNLGFKASYANDENMLIIADDRAVAERTRPARRLRTLPVALAAPAADPRPVPGAVEAQEGGGQLGRHCGPKQWESGPLVLHSAWHELKQDDGWQDYYEDHKNLLASEVNLVAAVRRGESVRRRGPSGPVGPSRPAAPPPGADGARVREPARDVIPNLVDP